MSRPVLIILFVVVVPLLLLGLGVLVGLRVRKTAFAGTGLDEWRRTARTLSWSDRRALYRANTRGRAAPAALAELAVQRGEAARAALERTTRRGSRFRLMWFGLGFLALANAGLRVLELATGDGSMMTWVNLGLQCSVAALWFSFPALQRRQLRLVRRSLQENRQVLERPVA